MNDNYYAEGVKSSQIKSSPCDSLFIPSVTSSNLTLSYIILYYIIPRHAYCPDRVLRISARSVDRTTSIETLVVSIAGLPPSEKDWAQLFVRMTGI